MMDQRKGVRKGRTGKKRKWSRKKVKQGKEKKEDVKQQVSSKDTEALLSEEGQDPRSWFSQSKWILV